MNFHLARTLENVCSFSFGKKRIDSLSHPPPEIKKSNTQKKRKGKKRKRREWNKKKKKRLQRVGPVYIRTCWRTSSYSQFAQPRQVVSGPVAPDCPGSWRAALCNSRDTQTHKKKKVPFFFFFFLNLK